MRLSFIHTINCFVFAFLVLSSINCTSKLKSPSKKKYNQYIFERSRVGQFLPIVLNVNLSNKNKSVELVCSSNGISSYFYSEVDTTQDLFLKRLESVLLRGQKLTIDSFQLAANKHMIINDSIYSKIESMRVSEVLAKYFDSSGFMLEEKMTNDEINATIKYFYKKRLKIVVHHMSGFYKTNF
jgi:hypothetical protein